MKPKPPVIDSAQLDAWREQSKREALDWHGKVQGVAQSRLADFAPGFDQGWRECLKTLKLHGFIAESHDRLDTPTSRRVG